MSFYGIEEKSTYHGTQYRYFSKYNGTRGSWVHHKELAEKQGEEHESIILFLHGKNVLKKDSIQKIVESIHKYDKMRAKH